MNEHIPITEIFDSVQMEGIELGVPTQFIRVYGCNMAPKCSFCDTDYSWRGNNNKLLTIKDVEKRMLTSKNRHYTFTGGEPTLYDEQIQRLRNTFITSHFSLETNGLYKTKVPYNTIMVSPKRQNHDLETLIDYNAMPSTYFKFVYEANKSKWWEKVIENINLNEDKIIIMPEGKTREEQINNMPEVINYCISKGYRFSPRGHILAWNTKKGV